MKKFIVLGVIVLSQLIVKGQGLGNGSDGSPNISGIINSYTNVTTLSNINCTSVVTVNSISNFSVGDLVAIIQMNGAQIDTNNNSSYGNILNYNSAGNFEFAKIVSISGLNITLNHGLINSYNPSVGIVQLIKVPQYNNPTITSALTCLKWNGSTGGVLILDAIGTVNFSADIDVSGQGFRGGYVSTQNSTGQIIHMSSYDSVPVSLYYGEKGEGIAGYGIGANIGGKGSPANAGGGGNAVNAGGGGGGNWGCGGNGGQGFTAPTYPGNPVLSQGLGGKPLNYFGGNSKIYMGGGGGAGDANNVASNDAGDGGGIIILNANSISGNNHQIISKGVTALNANNDGASGGGGGGAVLMSVNAFVGAINVFVDGGAGGNTASTAGYYHGPGGGGGGGAIILKQAATPPSVNLIYNGGVQGLCAGNNSLETDGCIGGILYNFSYPNNVNAIHNSHQSFSICSGDSVVLQLNPSATDITWSPITNLSCSNCSAPYAYPANNTIYIANDSINGCFSIDTFLVNVNHPSSSIINQTICANQPYNLNGTILSTTGTYVDTIPNHAGCDSVITLNLTVKPISTYSYNQTICSNQPYTFNGHQLNTTGTYYDTLTNYVGCDSVITLNLTVKPISTYSYNYNICSSQNYTFNGHQLNTTGTYYDTLVNYVGCDSFLTLNLVVYNPPSSSIVNQTICANQPYNLNGTILSTTGTYVDTIPNHAGCDSVITLNLIVKPISTYSYNQTICSNQPYTFNGQQLNTAGTYYDTLTNYVGCDSIITLHLTISNASSAILNAVICQGQTYSLPGGILVSTSGTYYDTLLNHNGCDSIINYVVYVQPIIPVELGNDTTLCNKTSLTISPLKDLPPSGILQWNNDATEPSITATTSGMYILTATYPPCPSQSDTIVLTAENCECRILMPNAFTPNTDNNNDVIIPIFDCHPAPDEYYFAIYNRWGEKVFSTDKTNEGWDGIYKNKDQELDVYVYMIRYKSIFDETTVILKGDITLIR